MQRENGRGKLWGGRPETLEKLALGRMGGRSQYAVQKRPAGRPVSYESWGLT